MANRRSKTLAAASLSLAEIEPLTKNQVLAFESENNLVLHGIAGRGKTFISCYLAFDDMRKVIPTLDNLIINDRWHGNYSRDKKNKNTMIYKRYETYFHRKIFERFNVKSFKIRLEIKVDGNTITIEGLGAKIKSILRDVKKVSIVKKSN